MEEKLESFRLRKRREENLQNIREKFLKMFSIPSRETSSEAKVVIDVSHNFQSQTIFAVHWFSSVK